MADDIRITGKELLSSNWSKLWKYSVEIKQKDGSIQKQEREVYDHGNGAAILLYNQERGTVILTRQFRLPSYVNGNGEGYLIEACAGLLDKDSPEDAIRREAEEETGYRVHEVRKVFETYMSPGTLTELLYLFVAGYDDTMKVNEGGGLDSEQENIEVIELPFADAVAMMASGKIRDSKTIILLQYALLNKLV